jgi:ADP-ribose pyrophosphatase YjhB (NUDIX family)
VHDYRTVAPAHQIYRHCPLCAATLRDEVDAVNERVRPTCESCGWTYYPANPIGALVAVETGSGIVLVHPPAGPPEAPASLPGGLVEYGETPEAGAVRIVREQTGLDVEVAGELIRFLQDGTPFGPVLEFGFVARAVAGELRTDGHEGPAAVYPLESMPAIIPVRAANQRVLTAYLDARRRRRAPAA